MLTQAKALDNDTIIYVDKSNWDIIVRLTQGVDVQFHPASAFVSASVDGTNTDQPNQLTAATTLLQYFQGHDTPGVSPQDKQIVSFIYKELSAMHGLLDTDVTKGTIDVYFGSHFANKQHPAVTFHLLTPPVAPDSPVPASPVPEPDTTPGVVPVPVAPASVSPADEPDTTPEMAPVPVDVGASTDAPLAPVAANTSSDAATVESAV